MKNHTILWTHLDWTMFNQGSMLLWMYRAMNEKLASEHAYDINGTNDLELEVGRQLRHMVSF